jgi:hypothetical protein
MAENRFPMLSFQNKVKCEEFQGRPTKMKIHIPKSPLVSFQIFQVETWR